MLLSLFLSSFRFSFFVFRFSFFVFRFSFFVFRFSFFVFRFSFFVFRFSFYPFRVSRLCYLPVSRSFLWVYYLNVDIPHFPQILFLLFIHFTLSLRRCSFNIIWASFSWLNEGLGRPSNEPGSTMKPHRRKERVNTRKIKHIYIFKKTD
jgi:hypothetical protein